MSRTFKSKEAQQVHNSNKYTKAFGYDYVLEWFPENSEDMVPNSYGAFVRAFANKQEKHKEYLYVKYKSAGYQKRNCVKGKNKRIENKKHRAKVRNLVSRYVSGKTEDIVTTAVGPRNPKQYW